MIARGRTAAVHVLGSHWTKAALIFALLAIVHTWPLVTEPGTLSRNDNGDAQLNEWILAWVAHQLPRHPLQLFQGNIFYPAKDVLAFSEPLIVPALLVAPALWLGASPVLAMNLAMLTGFALTGLGDLRAGPWLDSRSAGGDRRGIAVRLQHPHADPPSPRPGAARMACRCRSCWRIA